MTASPVVAGSLSLRLSSAAHSSRLTTAQLAWRRNSAAAVAAVASNAMGGPATSRACAWNASARIATAWADGRSRGGERNTISPVSKSCVKNSANGVMRVIPSP